MITRDAVGVVDNLRLLTSMRQLAQVGNAN